MAMSKLLIVGSTGYVGSHLADRLAERFEVHSFARSQHSLRSSASSHVLDLDDLSKLERVIATDRFDIVINCVALASPDACEKDPLLAKKVNVDLVSTLVASVNETNSKLLHISSNAVYDGFSAPYDEDSPRNPANVYGKTKAEADAIVLSEARRSLLIRPMTVIGPKADSHRHNPASMIMGRLKNGERVDLVDDVYGNLLFIEDLIGAIETLIDRDAEGQYNIAGAEVVNRYELGLIICRTLELDEALVHRVGSDHFQSLAPRAPDTSFDIRKIRSEIDFEPRSLAAGLAEISIRREA